VWAAALFGLSLVGATAAHAVQTSASLSVSPTNWGFLADGQTVDVTIRANNDSSDTPAVSFPGDTNAPKASSLAGPITVRLACADTSCTTSTNGVLSFVSVGGNGCVAKNAGVSQCVSGGANLVTINFGSAITIPAGGSVDIATIRVMVVNAGLVPQTGIKATTTDAAVTTCSTSLPSLCVACGAEGCTKLAFAENTLRGCPHPCPSKIRFLTGLDSFEFHADIDVSPGFDPPNNPVVVTLSNALFNPIFSYMLNGNQLVPGTDVFKFTNSSAKNTGGFDTFKVGKRDGTVNTWRVDIIIYDPNLQARATLANMTVNIQVGGDSFSITADWIPKSYGWFFDVP
jgi:hypothetical protein